ncbi:MAG: hypothetical protein AAF146_21230, partial [Bacteroidota bacterium]
MLALDRDLQMRKESLEAFGQLAERLLRYFPNVLHEYEEQHQYRIYRSQIAGVTKYIRPINSKLFLADPDHFRERFTALLALLANLRAGQAPDLFGPHTADQVLYTIQQAVGAGLDLLVDPNGARKHAGNRFEELIRAVFSEMGIANKKMVLQIPYETEDGTKIYQCENDLILSPYAEVRSTRHHLDPAEVVVSIKTTSKDRMGKIFIDKMLLERFVGHPQKVIGIFLNDVQRKRNDRVSFTLVSGLFMVYSQFLVELEGIYYLDPPPN